MDVVEHFISLNSYLLDIISLLAGEKKYRVD